MTDPGFDRLKQAIITLRGKEVVLDADLAAVLGIATKHLNQHVRRHQDLFGEDQVFRITKQEVENRRTQIENRRTHDVSANPGWGGRRSLPMAFTVPGLGVLADILPLRLRHPWLKDFIGHVRDPGPDAAQPASSPQPTPCPKTPAERPIVSADGADDGESPEASLARGLIDLFAEYELAILQRFAKAALVVMKARGERTDSEPTVAG